MANNCRKIAIIGAGINGLVAANYLLRAGHEITLFEHKDRVGGACVSETAVIDDIEHDYALGATTLGLMQDFVWQETGLADRLQIWAPSHPDLVFFPDQEKPTHLHANTADAAREFAEHWGEKGDLEAFYADEARVVQFLQVGYRAGIAPSVAATVDHLGADLTRLWITGSARNLVDHYLTADRTKVNVTMDVSESGPVSLDEPGSAFIMPMMSSGSVFGGNYGYVRGGIWQITKALGQINQALGMHLELSCTVHEVDPASGKIRFENTAGAQADQFDHIVFATIPQTAARLTGSSTLIEKTDNDRVLGTSGKLNLVFRNPVRWKHDSEYAADDTAFRYLFACKTLDESEAATMAVVDGPDFVPGYYQIYCEGAAMRQMGLVEPFDRLAVFFKNLALGKTGEELASVGEEVKALILSYIANPEDCVWSRLLTPRDLQNIFGFQGGNIEHTMLSSGQSYADRHYADVPERRFYQFGAFENLSICGSSTYPCGSVAGTPGYMCVKELLRALP